jgi:hypothetical protein
LIDEPALPVIGASFEPPRHAETASAPRLVILPSTSSVVFGLHGHARHFALGHGMREVWQLTEIVTDCHLTAPFRVGTGPITPTIGV